MKRTRKTSRKTAKQAVAQKAPAAKPVKRVSLADRELRAAYEGKSALVLGGSGFIGHHLVQRLADLGALVTAVTTRISNVPNKWRVNRNISMIQGDLRNRLQMDSLVTGAEYLFNFAGTSGAVESGETPSLDLEMNGYGLLNLLEACRRVNPNVRIIFPGSRLQYGKPRRLPVDESHPQEPICMYGVHKLLGERYHLLYHRNYGLRTTVLRMSNVYGPDDHQPGRVSYNIVNQFMRLALEDAPLKIYGDGKQLRDYLYVRDAVEAILRVAKEPKAIGEVYNLGSGKPVRFVEMARAIVTAAHGSALVYDKWPAAAKLVETGDFYMNIKRLGKLLGWKPAYDIKAGVTEMIAALRGK